MNAVFSDSARAGGYIADEASVNLSRKEIVVAAGSGLLKAGTVLGKIADTGAYTAYSPDNTDGSEEAAAVLFDGVDATDEDVRAVASTFTTAVNAAEIIWPEGITDAELAAAIASLEERGITVLPADGVTLPSPVTGDRE